MIKEHKFQLNQIQEYDLDNKIPFKVQVINNEANNNEYEYHFLVFKGEKICYQTEDSSNELSYLPDEKNTYRVKVKIFHKHDFLTSLIISVYDKTMDIKISYLDYEYDEKNHVLQVETNTNINTQLLYSFYLFADEKLLVHKINSIHNHAIFNLDLNPYQSVKLVSKITLYKNKQVVLNDSLIEMIK